MHAHKPWITAGFVTVCCSMSMVAKQNFMQPFLRSMKLLRYTHTWTKKSWAESLALMHDVIIMVLTWSKLNYTVRDLTVPSVSSLPLSFSPPTKSLGTRLGMLQRGSLRQAAVPATQCGKMRQNRNFASKKSLLQVEQIIPSACQVH